jgi:hypothetical protein
MAAENGIAETAQMVTTSKATDLLLRRFWRVAEVFGIAPVRTMSAPRSSAAMPARNSDLHPPEIAPSARRTRQPTYCLSEVPGRRG